MIVICIISLFCTLFSGCTPLKSSPKEEKHQMELTLHELQTGIDDLAHDYSCYQTELQILDSKINKQDENISKIKEQELPVQEDRIKEISQEIIFLRKQIADIKKTIQNSTEDIHRLSCYANETSLAFSQYKSRMDELEKAVTLQNQKFAEIVKLKSTIQSLAHLLNSFSVYRVKKGDSLEKIAKDFETNIEEIKRINHLNNDLIVIGQELKIPSKH